MRCASNRRSWCINMVETSLLQYSDTQMVVAEGVNNEQGPPPPPLSFPREEIFGICVLSVGVFTRGDCFCFVFFLTLNASQYIYCVVDDEHSFH